MTAAIKLEPSWKYQLKDEFEAAYMQSLRMFLKSELKAGKTIYPKPYQYFSALNLTPFNQVKVVILGQDPYHGEGQAHGLCFSVPPQVRMPPSLLNIYKALAQDLGLRAPQHGCFVAWAKQGVLLLNSVLTVEKGKAASHQNKGWETFTDAVVAALNAERKHIVFILWGSYAQRKGRCIDRQKHLVLEGVHPSPLSAHRGFFGQRYFSQANAYLQQHGKQAVDWSLGSREEAETLFQQAEAMNLSIYS